jgi:cytoskeletal protein CcmA (bactofilin family)
MTHIAPGSRIRGEITGPTELLIEGEVEGEVRVDSVVVVGTEGVVQGPVSAQTVRVSGRVVGNIQASDRVEIAPAGSLEGDIAAPRVVIAEGAFFKGRVEMKGNQEREARRPKASGEPRNQ